MRSVTQFSNAPIEWCRSPFCMHQHQQQHRAAHNFHFDLMLPFIAPFIFLAHSNSHTKKISCCFFSLPFCPSRSFQLLLSFVGAEQTFSFHRFRSRCATKCSSSSLFPLCVCFFFSWTEKQSFFTFFFSLRRHNENIVPFLFHVVCRGRQNHIKNYFWRKKIIVTQRQQHHHIHTKRIDKLIVFAHLDERNPKGTKRAADTQREKGDEERKSNKNVWIEIIFIFIS